MPPRSASVIRTSGGLYKADTAWWNSLLVDCAAEQQSGGNALMGMTEFLYVYSSSAVDRVWDWIPETFSADGWELKIGVLQKGILLIFSDIEETWLHGFSGRTVWSKSVNWYPILALHCCYIPDGRDMSEIQHRKSVEKPCSKCINKMADFKLFAVRRRRP